MSGSLSYNSKTDEDGRITNYTSILAGKLPAGIHTCNSHLI